jgi:hypothetical protein
MSIDISIMILTKKMKTVNCKSLIIFLVNLLLILINKPANQQFLMIIYLYAQACQFVNSNYLTIHMETW